MKAIRVAKKLRARIGRFSGELCLGLCLPAQRFVSEMVYGIQAAQSVMLSWDANHMISTSPCPQMASNWRGTLLTN